MSRPIFRKKYHNNWVEFYPKLLKGGGFKLMFQKTGYSDSRPQLFTNVTTVISLILPFISLWLIPLSILFCVYSWGALYIKIPYITLKNNTDVYGIMIYSPIDKFPNLIRINEKSFELPWETWIYKIEVLCNTGWEKESDKNKITLESHPFLNPDTKQLVTATISQFKVYQKSWFNLYRKATRCIKVEFSDGSEWLTYKMKKGETALGCLQRMERERKF